MKLFQLLFVTSLVPILVFAQETQPTFNFKPYAPTLPGPPEPMRAATLLLDPPLDMNLKVGSKAQVIWEVSIKDKLMKIVIAENAKILKIDKAGQHAKIEITIMMTNEESRKVSLASTAGKLTLMNKCDECISSFDEVQRNLNTE